MESKRDEQTLEDSARASRKRMSFNDWVEEAIQNGEFDDIDAEELGKEVLSIYRRWHEMDDCCYIGNRIRILIKLQIEDIVKPKYEEFWNEE